MAYSFSAERIQGLFANDLIVKGRLQLVSMLRHFKFKV